MAASASPSRIFATIVRARQGRTVGAAFGPSHRTVRCALPASNRGSPRSLRRRPAGAPPPAISDGSRARTCGPCSCVTCFTSAANAGEGRARAVCAHASPRRTDGDPACLLQPLGPIGARIDAGVFASRTRASSFTGGMNIVRSVRHGGKRVGAGGRLAGAGDAAEQLARRRFRERFQLCRRHRDGSSGRSRCAGYWKMGANAGIFAMDAVHDPSETGAAVGFRCAR